MISGVGGCCTLGGSKISGFPAGRGLAKVLGSEERAQRSLGAALNRFEAFVPLRHNVKGQESVEEARRIFNKMGFAYRYYDSSSFERGKFMEGCHAILREMKRYGIRVLTEARALKVTAAAGGFRITALHQGRNIDIFAKRLILGVGRLGHKLVADFLAPRVGAPQLNDHIDVGVRLEFPSTLWPDIDFFHNDLKLEFGSARTFCVCKEGKLAPYRMGEVFLAEGSRDISTRTEFTNIAILVRKPLNGASNKDVLVNEILGRLLKAGGGALIRQPLTDFLGVTGHSSAVGNTDVPHSFWRWDKVGCCFPGEIMTEVRQAVEYFVHRLFGENDWHLISVFAPELDYYWPKYKISANFSTTVPNAYLIGDCTGHFRGILQAFCSGILCAQAILREANAF